MIPGSNLLAQALTIIGSQPVKFYKAVSRVENAAGYLVGQYAPAIPVWSGSVQPVPRGRYESLGLEMARNYVTWFVPMGAVALDRNSSGDQIEWPINADGTPGDRYQLQDATEWVVQDGWTSIVCVKLLDDKNA